MADRGRDLKISILSDVDRFDLDKPAAELDDLGDKAKATAGKVDDAFDKIAKSSRSNLRGVGTDADRAKKKLDDFKDEAHDTGREAAASFSGGFDDITDAVQEIGANAFSKLGKTGMLAGGALAIALGFVVSKAQEANEKITELRNTFYEFMKSNPGSGPSKALQEFMDNLDADTINDFDNALKATGISQREFYEAMAQGGDKAKALRERLNDMVGINMPWDQQAMEAQHLSNALGDTIKAHEGAAGAAETYADVAGEAIRKQAEYEKAVTTTETALRRVGDSTSTTAGIVEEKAQAMADASKDPADAWSDFADKVDLSAGDIITSLDEQTKAMQDFSKNLAVVAQEGSAEFLDWVEGQGPAVAKAYAKSTAGQRKAIRDAFARNVGAAQGEGIAEGLQDKVGAVERAAAATRAAAKRAALGDGPIVIPTTVKAPSAADIARVRSTMQSLLGTIAVKAVANASVRSTP